MNLKCLVLRHKWRPAEKANEAGLRLACQRCGKFKHRGEIAPVGSSGDFAVGDERAKPSGLF
jgi:hypothetical protein